MVQLAWKFCRCIIPPLAALALLWAPTLKAQTPANPDFVIALGQMALRDGNLAEAWSYAAQALADAERTDDEAAARRARAFMLSVNAAVPPRQVFNLDAPALAVLPGGSPEVITTVSADRMVNRFDAATTVVLAQQPLRLVDEPEMRQFLDNLNVNTPEIMGLDAETFLQGLVDRSSGRAIPLGPNLFAFGSGSEISAFRRDNGVGLTIARGVTWETFDDLVAVLTRDGHLSVQRIETNGTSLIAREIVAQYLPDCELEVDQYGYPHSGTGCTAIFHRAASGEIIVFYTYSRIADESHTTKCMVVGEAPETAVVAKGIPYRVTSEFGILTSRDQDGPVAELVDLSCALTPAGGEGVFGSYPSTGLEFMPDEFWNPSPDILVGYNEDLRTGVLIEHRQSGDGRSSLFSTEGPYPSGIASVATTADQQMTIIGDLHGVVSIYETEDLFDSSDSMPVLQVPTGDCDPSRQDLLSSCAISLLELLPDGRTVVAGRGDDRLFYITLPDPPDLLGPGEKIVGIGYRHGSPILAVLRETQDGSPIDTEWANWQNHCALTIRMADGSETFDQVEGLCNQTAPIRVTFMPDGRHAIYHLGSDRQWFEVGEIADSRHVWDMTCDPGQTCNERTGEFISLSQTGDYLVVEYYDVPGTSGADGERDYTRRLALLSTSDGSKAGEIEDPLFDETRGSFGGGSQLHSYNFGGAAVVDAQNYAISLVESGVLYGPLLLRIDGQSRNIPLTNLNRNLDTPSCLELLAGDVVVYAKDDVTLEFDLRAGTLGEARTTATCYAGFDERFAMLGNEIHDMQAAGPIASFSRLSTQALADPEGSGVLVYDRYGYAELPLPPEGRDLIAWARMTTPVPLTNRQRQAIGERHDPIVDSGQCFTAPDWLFDPDRRSDQSLLTDWWEPSEVTGEEADRAVSCLAAEPRSAREHYMRGLGIAVGGGMVFPAFNEAALEDLEIAARRGNRAAVLVQGLIWIFRRDGQEDLARGLALAERAWDREVSGAAVILGIAAEIDWLSGRDERRVDAQNWFLRAACAGQPVAFARLSSMVEQDLRSDSGDARLLVDVPNDLGCRFPLAAEADNPTRLLAFQTAAMLLAPSASVFNEDTGWQRAGLARSLPAEQAVSLQRDLDRWVASR